MQDKNELRQKIQELEKEAKAAKKKRELKTTAGFAVAYFLVFWFMEKKIEDIRTLGQLIFVSIFLAVIHFAVNDVVFDHLHTKRDDDQKIIARLKKELDENTAPTNNVDSSTKYSLSDIGETPKTCGNYQYYGKDIGPTEDPLAEFLADDQTPNTPNGGETDKS